EWSPVDDRLLVKLAPTPLTDDGYMRTRVRVVDPKTGEITARIQNPGKLGHVRWSPDASRVALVSGADIHDPSAGRLMICAATGGEPTDVLTGIEEDVSAFEWQGSDALLVVGSKGLWSTFSKVTVDAAGKGTLKRILEGPGPVLTTISISKDGLHGAFVG